MRVSFLEPPAGRFRGEESFAGRHTEIAECIAMSVELSEVERLRERLRKMIDGELVQFRDAARMLCGGKNPQKAFVVRLEKSRAEWRRRHPK
jgi:hypothetical protein